MYTISCTYKPHGYPLACGGRPLFIYVVAIATTTKTTSKVVRLLAFVDAIFAHGC